MICFYRFGKDLPELLFALSQCLFSPLVVGHVNVCSFKIQDFPIRIADCMDIYLILNGHYQQIPFMPDFFTQPKINFIPEG